MIWKVWGRKRCMYVWLCLWAMHASRHLLSMFAYCPVWGILEVLYVFVGNGIPICQFLLVIFRTSNIRYWRFSYKICRSCKSWVDFGGRADKRYTHLSSMQYLLSYIYLCLLCFYEYLIMSSILMTPRGLFRSILWIESHWLIILNVSRLDRNISDPVLKWTEIGVLQSKTVG